MKSRYILFLLAIVSLLIFPGCAAKIVPTDVCNYQISLSDIDLGSGVDAIDFFDLAIDVAKEHRFAPPMKFDKNVGMLVFGHEDVNTMPGLKMVVYMWVPNEDLSAIKNICINTQILETKDAPVTENMAADIVSNFVDDLKYRYREKQENAERLMKKYNVN